MGSSVRVLYVILRKDLIAQPFDWPLGALITQATHAVSALLWTFRTDPAVEEYMEDINNMRKVTLQVNSATELEKVAAKLREKAIDFYLWTEQPENIVTCIAVKPYIKSEIHAHLKSLKLFS